MLDYLKHCFSITSYYEYKCKKLCKELDNLHNEYIPKFKAAMPFYSEEYERVNKEFMEKYNPIFRKRAHYAQKVMGI